MRDFIEWTGGEPPVPAYSQVILKFRDKSLNSDTVWFSQSFDWSHDNSETDIVAYKLTEEQPEFNFWFGGNNPVGNAVVEYVLRDTPDIVYSTNGNDLDWAHEIDDPDYDIILYRIIQ